MAVVFRAQDLKHQRPVAIKVLKPELTSALWAQRFLREIQIASRLQHPHILPLYDSGQAGDLLYYVMPYVAGESLRARLLREGTFPIPQALRLAREVAGGLGYAHEQGVVHRDIKPENILLSSDHALICDFGIARALSLAGADSLTEPGLAIGTASYMSPEQSMGRADIDARSDIYSLGCLVFEMLAGKPPFRGATKIAVMFQHTSDAPPSLRRFRSEIPVSVEAAVTRALAKVPEHRFATAAQFAAQLDLASPAPSGSDTVVTAPSGAPARIVVLPFANLGPGPETEYLSDGISEELIQTLAHIDGLRVVARTSAFAFKGKREDVRAIGERLQVNLILDGSVRLMGDRVRVSAQLVAAADGYELWSGQYERPAGDAFAIEDEIARTIAEVLRSHLPAGGGYQPTRASRCDPIAHELYLKGRYHWNRRTETGLERSIEYFRQAIDRAPADVASHAALADSYLLLGIYGAAPPGDVMPKARESAERALAVNPKSAEALTAMGCVRALYEWDWVRAEADLRLAVELKPDYPTAHQWRAMHLLIPLGRFEEARAALASARELDPLSPAILTSLAVASFFGRDYARAVRELQDVLDLDPGFGAAHYFLGQCHLWRGAPEFACAVLERAASLTGRTVETLAGLAYALGVSGRRAEAEAILEDLMRRSVQGYVSPARIAQIHLALGDQSLALDWLERALDQRSVDVVWVGVHPMFDQVREEKRFAAALEKIGLPDSELTRRTRVSSPPGPTSVSH